MKSSESLRVLAEITSSQWGLVTTAQAQLQGVSRVVLSRLADAGHIERIAHGVYKDSGVPSDAFEELRASWLSTEAKVLAERRLRDRMGGVIVASTSAALLHGIGDFWSDRHEFVAPNRRQSQRAEIRFRQRRLDGEDISIVEGLPTMTVERTIADLLEEIGDLSLVGDALRDANQKRSLDLKRLGALLTPLADRNGFPKGNGSAFLKRLLQVAEIDTESVAKRTARDPALGPLIAANVLRNIGTPSIARSLVSDAMQESMKPIREALAKSVSSSLGPHLESLSKQIVESAAGRLVSDSTPKDIAMGIAAQFVHKETLNSITEDLLNAISANIESTSERMSSTANGKKR